MPFLFPLTSISTSIKCFGQTFNWASGLRSVDCCFRAASLVFWLLTRRGNLRAGIRIRPATHCFRTVGGWPYPGRATHIERHLPNGTTPFNLKIPVRHFTITVFISPPSSDDHRRFPSLSRNWHSLAGQTTHDPTSLLFPCYALCRKMFTVSSSFRPVDSKISLTISLLSSPAISINLLIISSLSSVLAPNLMSGSGAC